MSRDELVKHIRDLLVQAAKMLPQAPKPGGTFMASLPTRTVSGQRIEARDGSAFYLAVFTADAFETTVE
jgi:hypothetical protein